MRKLIQFTSISTGALCYRLGATLLIALMASLMIFQKVSTQSSGEDDWSQPVNLSTSGSTSNPIVLVDSLNITHAIWLDSYSGYRHAQAGEDGIWSEPGELVVPFDAIQPRVMMGPNDLIYTFWLSEGSLNYSRVRSVSAGKTIAWERARVLAVDALAFDVFIDVDQTIHIAYLKRSDGNVLPAGVYYRQKPSSKDWTTDQLIYESQYFRTMQSDQAHVSVTAGVLTGASAADGTPAVRKQLYVAWDEPFMFRSMISSATEGSNDWRTPVEIDPIGGATASGISFEPDLTIWNDQILIVWKKLLSLTTCEILYKVSGGDQQWSPVEDFFSSFNGCPVQSDFIAQQDDLVVWQAEIGNQVFLAAWNGSQWSEPHAEADLTGFWNPASGQTIAMGDRHLFYQTETNELLAVGCDINGNQDVWHTRRSLKDMTDWFLPYSAWEPSQVIVPSSSGMDDISIITDTEGSYHVVWTQMPPSVLGGQDAVVHYARWDGTTWSDPSAVIADSEGTPLQLSAALSRAGQFMLIWRRNSGCQIVFTRVPVDRVFSTVEWMDPVLLPTPNGICSSPTIAAGMEGMVYAAYAVAVNEGRGIYLNRSTDGGRTWEDAIQIFDAQAAGWGMVDQPVLSVHGNRLDLLWQRGAPLDMGVGQGLGYAYSEDGGLTWSKADMSIETPLRWADLVVSPNGILVRVWQQESSDQTQISTQISLDGGQKWLPVTSISNDGESIGIPDLVVDAAGGIHLLQALRDNLGKSTLRHWVWANDNWLGRESVSLGYDVSNPDFELSAAISSDAHLAVVYINGNRDAGEQSIRMVMNQTGVNEASLAGLQPIQGIPSSTDVPPELTEIATEPNLDDPTTTPTAIAANEQFSEDRPEQPNTWIGLIVGAVLAFLVVGAVFGRRFLQTKK